MIKEPPELELLFRFDRIIVANSSRLLRLEPMAKDVIFLDMSTASEFRDCLSNFSKYHTGLV